MSDDDVIIDDVTKTYLIFFKKSSESYVIGKALTWGAKYRKAFFATIFISRVMVNEIFFAVPPPPHPEFA